MKQARFVSVSPARLYFLTAFLLLLSVSAGAQRPIDPLPARLSCYQYPCEPIDHVPPLRTDMPLDVILGYIYYDSLCRVDLSFDQIDSLAALIRSYDTIRPFLRFLYEMTDYDPILFDEYAFWGYDVTTQYKNSGSNFLLDIARREDSVLGPNSKIRFLCNTSLILRVHILDMYRDTVPSAENLPLNCYSALILDTIKGKHFPSSILNTKAKDTKGSHIQSSSGEIGFVISPEWQKFGSNSDVKVITINPNDTRSVDIPNQYGDSSVAVGSDYILCLNTSKEFYDGTHVFRDFWPASHYSMEGGIFKIDNSGNVVVPSNFFGYGTSVPLITFLARIRSDIRSIIAH